MSCKKILILLLFVIASCFLTACNDNNNQTNKYKLPDLNGKTIENYLDFIDDSVITVVDRKEFNDSIPVDEFIKYGNNLEVGQEVDEGTIVYIYFSKGEELEDNEGPNILGIDDVEIKYASNYFEEFDPKEGVTVVDEIDGIIPENSWRVSGTINYYKLGDYELTYTAWDNSGNQTIEYRTVTVVPNELDTRYTDNLELDVSYIGKNYIEDKIAAVTLESCIDGDTARFSDSYQSFNVRFLGIDTPESTPRGGYEPWGKAASTYTCDVLQNANTIVIEAEGNLTDTYGRYLGWIWVDGRLLNLELVEQAYSTVKLTDSSKYYDIFFQADLKASGSKRRVFGDFDSYGEEDPDYDYENERFK